MSSGRLSQFLQNPFSASFGAARRQTCGQARFLAGSYRDGRRLPESVRHVGQEPRCRRSLLCAVHLLGGWQHAYRLLQDANSSRGGRGASVRYDPLHPERNSADPVERLRTELLIAASIGLVALYFAIAWHL